MGTTVTHAPAMEGLSQDSEPRHGPVKPERPAALKRRRRRENLAGYLFMSPWIAGFLLLTAGPMIASLYYAFTDYNLFDAPQWIGFDNFSEMFGDPRWRHSVQVTLWYVAVGTPLKLIAALGVALLLAQSRRGQAFYRAAFYAPSLIGASVSVAIVWKAIFSDDAIVDRTQKIFGIDVGGWTGDPDMIIYSLVALTVWQFGAPMVIFLAGLKQIPADLYEAASMDGAGPVRKFFNITWPMLSPVIFFNLLMETIHAFQIFASAYIISNGEGGPAGSTLFYTLYLYLRGFSDFRMGYASAMAWLLVIVVGVITLIFFKTSKQWVHYSGDSK